MAEKSKIQWTDATWNPWHGCKKVSPGCKFCYMYRDKERYGHDPTDVLKSKSKFRDPLKWSADMQMGMPRGSAFPGMKIFTCSWSDFFIEEADQWRDDAWRIIKDTPEFTYQILTKRPERIKECLPSDWGTSYKNVWLGVSVENEKVSYDRIWQLCKIPAYLRFLSVEPLLGIIDLALDAYMTIPESHIKGPKLKHLIDWVIIGGESGNDSGKYRYRECQIPWIESIINQCKENDVPVFVKQLGTHLSKELSLKDRHGGNIDEWPNQLKIRQFP